MKRMRVMIMLGIFGFCSLLGGCLAISAQEDCSCVKQREKFAELVAQKVLEKQQLHQQQIQDESGDQL